MAAAPMSSPHAGACIGLRMGGTGGGRRNGLREEAIDLLCAEADA